MSTPSHGQVWPTNRNTPRQSRTFPSPPVSTAGKPRVAEEVHSGTNQHTSFLQRLTELPDDLYMWFIIKAMDLQVDPDVASKTIGFSLAIFLSALLFGVKLSDDESVKVNEHVLFGLSMIVSMANFLHFLFQRKQFELPSASAANARSRRITEPYEFWDPSPCTVIMLCLVSPVQVLIIYTSSSVVYSFFIWMIYALIGFAVATRVQDREAQTRRLNGVVYREIQNLQHEPPRVSQYCQKFAPSPPVNRHAGGMTYRQSTGTYRTTPISPVFSSRYTTNPYVE